MARRSWAERVGSAGSDPWLALVSALGGGMAWAAIPGNPVGIAIAVGAGMFGAGVAVGALRAGEDDAPYAVEDEPEVTVKLVPGTEQAEVVDTLTQWVKDLRALREGPLAAPMRDPAIDALVAAEGATRTARRVAAAIDGLDTALARSNASGPRGVRDAVERMSVRRANLLAVLHSTADGVAEVYTKLLETSATVESPHASLDALRSSLADLERADSPGPR